MMAPATAGVTGTDKRSGEYVYEVTTSAYGVEAQAAQDSISRTSKKWALTTSSGGIAFAAAVPVSNQSSRNAVLAPPALVRRPVTDGAG
jgi:hypothetical protein